MRLKRLHKAANTPIMIGSKAYQVVFKSYGLIVAMFIAIWVLVGDKLGVMACATNCLPAVLFPVFFGLPLVVKRRDRMMALWTVIAALTIVILYGERLLPRNTERPDSEANTLRILSHNMGQDLPDYNHIDQLIRESNADFVFLQELTGEYLEEHLPLLIDAYPYQVHGPLLDEKRVGMGLLSKHPIVQDENFKLDPDGLVFQQRVVVDRGKQRFVLYNIHTTFPWVTIDRDPVLGLLPWPRYDDAVRRREIDAFLSRVLEEPYPIIAAGDFNLNEQSSDYRKLTKLLRDAYAFAGSGFGFTWPANRTPSVMIRPAIPFVRIDYVFHSPTLQARTARVLPKTGSDHKPIMVELDLEPLVS